MRTRRRITPQSGRNVAECNVKSSCTPKQNSQLYQKSNSACQSGRNRSSQQAQPGNWAYAKDEQRIQNDVEAVCYPQSPHRDHCVSSPSEDGPDQEKLDDDEATSQGNRTVGSSYFGDAR